MTESQLNWAGNYTYQAARVHRPESVDQVRQLVAAAGRVKALGSRHSFNAIADTAGDLISLERLEGIVALDAVDGADAAGAGDAARRTVTVQGGIRYGTLARALHAAGLALPNTASLPHISVAGACATATHGSGDRNGGLATTVAALELVTAGGEVLALSRDRGGERFRGAVVGLGALGVVTQLTLDVVPGFLVRQDVFEDLPLAALETSLDAITGSAYSVSLFTDWRTDRVNQVWLKERVTEGAPPPERRDFFGARPASVNRHPIISLSAENCTEQLGVPGPWHERLPHFKMEFTPSSGAELQSEYFVPRRHAVAAVRAVHGMRERIAPHLQISEVRTVAADDLWLSPCYGQDCVALHFTWVQDWPAVSALLPQLEAQLAPFEARPHWAKLFTMGGERLRALYPRLPEFRALQRELDPTGKFRNAYLDEYVLG